MQIEEQLFSKKVLNKTIQKLEKYNLINNENINHKMLTKISIIFSLNIFPNSTTLNI